MTITGLSDLVKPAAHTPGDRGRAHCIQVANHLWERCDRPSRAKRVIGLLILASAPAGYKKTLRHRVWDPTPRTVVVCRSALFVCR